MNVLCGILIWATWVVYHIVEFFNYNSCVWMHQLNRVFLSDRRIPSMNDIIVSLYFSTHRFITQLLMFLNVLIQDLLYLISKLKFAFIICIWLDFIFFGTQWKIRLFTKYVAYEWNKRENENELFSSFHDSNRLMLIRLNEGRL